MLQLWNSNEKSVPSYWLVVKPRHKYLYALDHTDHCRRSIHGIFSLYDDDVTFVELFYYELINDAVSTSRINYRLYGVECEYFFGIEHLKN
jgi:hypothetical protein